MVHGKIIQLRQKERQQKPSNKKKYVKECYKNSHGILHNNKKIHVCVFVKCI